MSGTGKAVNYQSLMKSWNLAEKLQLPLYSLHNPSHTLNIYPLPQVSFSFILKENYLCMRYIPLHNTSTNQNVELWSPVPRTQLLHLKLRNYYRRGAEKL